MLVFKVLHMFYKNFKLICMRFVSYLVALKMEDENKIKALTVKQRLLLAQQGRFIDILSTDPDRRVRAAATEYDLDILIDDDAAFDALMKLD